MDGRGHGKLSQRKTATVNNESQSRPRAGSKDSEKENIPNTVAVKTEHTVVTDAKTNGPTQNKSPSGSVESVKSVDQSKTKTVDRQVKPAPVRRGNVKPGSSDKNQSKSGDKTVIGSVVNKSKVEEKSEVKPKGPSSAFRQNAWEKPLKVVEKQQVIPANDTKAPVETKTEVVDDAVAHEEATLEEIAEQQTEDQLEKEIDSVSLITRVQILM